MSINFFSEGTDYKLHNQNEILKWINRVISDKNCIPGTINYIFCTDKYLLTLNTKYLNHDTYTDVITFDYSKSGVISGDIFISIDMVNENAKSFNQLFIDELHRVIIHGILHLCGLKDKTVEESNQMRNQENHYLSLLE
jgi:probable rRNA maturation factor